MAVETSEKVVKMEDLLKKSASNENQDQKEYTKPKEKKKPNTQPIIPRGKPKSGKIWKEPRKKFSSIIKTKGIRDSFEKKEALRKELARIKETSRAVIAGKQQEKELKKQRRRENLKRQEENRKKSEVVQVIKNTSKIKRMKKKQLRNIEKRDTNNM